MTENPKKCDNYYETDSGRHKCKLEILEDFNSRKKYNCVKLGVCSHFEHKIIADQKRKDARDKWERETYKRLKKKFEEPSISNKQNSYNQHNMQLKGGEEE